jgi:predicted AAA+ superfamily ATPase
MNDNHSYNDLTYRPRWAAAALRAAASTSPVVVLTGARQVGKSTLLLNEEPFRGWRYVSLDDFDVLAQARRDPSELWAGAAGVVLDEVQKAPGMLDAVKLAVDRDGSRRFALSGSANLLLMQHVGESLAGRASYFRLGPMTQGESAGLPMPTVLADLLDGRLPDEGRRPSVDPLPIMIRGLMPRLLTASESEATRWWDGYVATYVERDLRQLSQVESLPDFRRVMSALALRQGGLLNRTEVGRDTSVTQPTVHRFVNLLEMSEILALLSAYAVNRTKRLTKSPRPYFFDVGLASFLGGHYDAESLRASREAGGSFEALVHQTLAAQVDLLTPRGRLHYWRTVSGAEVDFVLEHGRRLVAFEVKLATSVGYGDAAGLRTFMQEYPECACGVVVHSGEEVRMLGDRIVGVPWTVLAGL